MNEIARRQTAPMTADDFLTWPGDGTGRKHELVDGEIRSVSPASRTHGTIQSRLSTCLQLAIERAGLALEVVTEGAIVAGPNPRPNVRVPDLLVTGAPDHEGQIAVPEPTLIVEILSPGNQGETRDNVTTFQALGSVREILVMHSTQIRAEIYRRDAAGLWADEPMVVGPGGRLDLPSAALDIPIEAAYRGTWLARGPRDGA